MTLREVKSLTNIVFLTLLFSVLGLSTTFAGEHEEPKEEGKFNASKMIVHHIADSHEWHFGEIGETHIVLPLPIIIYSTTNGLQIFSSAVFEHGTKSYNGYSIEHEHIISEDPKEKVFDFSITKNVASMLLAAFIILFIFLSVSASYKSRRGKAPRGLQSFFESLIVFVRDEIAIPNIGEKKHATYLPYLLTVFFFIWLNNMLGLLPQGANASGNIAFTMTLACFTLLITIFSGNKEYWGHIFKAPGVPIPLLLIMTPVEIIGIFTKPFALMIRLFANITAGHIIILSILSFIFIFKNILIAAVSVPFAVIMSMMEVFVAALQAYIFTLLSALFIGQAVAEHEHHDDHH
ncbi:MAG: F0F1 ATP synthase subunit A [Bacteroidota bacterium]|nr:F0F1 ATP synthase subunit A [Bacteroidota bacterium]